MAFCSRSNLFKAAEYVCYMTETILPAVAAYTEDEDLAVATLPFAVLGTAFWCYRFPSERRTPGLHNLAHLIGLGTSIASVAANVSSQAFQMLSAMTAGCFGGNLCIECLEKHWANNDRSSDQGQNVQANLREIRVEGEVEIDPLPQQQIAGPILQPQPMFTNEPVFPTAPAA